MRAEEADIRSFSGPPALGNVPAEEVIDQLRGQVTAKRFERLASVASTRTYNVTVVMETLSDPHNVSAILRTCDALGIQRAHCIAGRFGFLASSGVTRGAHKWLDIVEHEDTTELLSTLKKETFSLWVASVEGDATLDDLERSEGKKAVVLGHERKGPSEALKQAADHVYHIPMRGFVESYNVSVAAALSLHAATQRADHISVQRKAVPYSPDICWQPPRQPVKVRAHLSWTYQQGILFN